MTFIIRAVLALFVFTLAPISQAGRLPSRQSSSCRCLLGDACWPNSEEWAKLNSTVGGRLIATVPLGSPCHDPTYNATECAALAQWWAWPNYHEESPSSIIGPWWQNSSCTPYTPQSTPCMLGNYVDYSIKVSSWQDAAAGVRFAQENNIRLVIKNTGHDYLGKSTGKGALGLWTHNMRSTNIVNYNSSFYDGPALRMGAGVRGYEAYEAVQPYGLQVVGGDCPSVGLAGGYTQGGGHSTLSSQYGLGADQALEWEVVTAEGDHIIASPTQHSDLYWALSGGGPGTYGVVISLTVKAHQDGSVGGASLTFSSAGIPNDTYWQAIASWQTGLPALVDSGATAVYIMTREAFSIVPLTAPKRSVAEVYGLLQPFTSTLETLNITYSLNVTSEPTFLGHFLQYLGPVPYGSYPTAQLLGGRLVPRSVVQEKNDALVAVMRNITENTSFYIAATALNVGQKSNRSAVAANAVLPAWRDALLSILVPGPWDFTIPRSVEVERENQLTHEVIPQLTALTPGSGTYLNEADFQLPTWKEDFYGSNYDTLRSIKSKYDPHDLFYATTAVGSDAWTVATDGRLCRAY